MAKINLHLNPKALLPTRYIQILLTILFLILLCFAGINHGWWTDITAGLALGAISGGVALLSNSYSIYTLHQNSSNNPFGGESVPRAVLVAAPDVMLLLLWAGTVAVMAKPKGKNWRKPYDLPPYVSWVACIVLGVVDL
jgi:hypothetical protein